MLRTSFRWPPSPCISRTHTLVSMFHRRSAESCTPHQPSRQSSNEELEHHREDTEPSECICAQPRQLLSVRSVAWHVGPVQTAIRMSMPKRTGSTRELLSADSGQSASETHKMVVFSEGCAPCLR